MFDERPFDPVFSATHILNVLAGTAENFGLHQDGQQVGLFLDCDLLGKAAEELRVHSLGFRADPIQQEENPREEFADLFFG